MLLFILASYLFIELPNQWLWGGDYSARFDMLISLFLLSGLFIYYALAARRFYKTAWWRCAAGSLLVMGVFAVSLVAYRMLLFYNVLNGIHR